MTQWVSSVIHPTMVRHANVWRNIVIPLCQQIGTSWRTELHRGQKRLSPLPVTSDLIVNQNELEAPCALQESDTADITRLSHRWRFPSLHNKGYLLASRSFLVVWPSITHLMNCALRPTPVRACGAALEPDSRTVALLLGALAPHHHSTNLTAREVWQVLIASRSCVRARDRPKCPRRLPL